MAVCPRETCFWPEVGCDMGHLDHAHCPSLKAHTTEKPEGQPPPDAVSMPWSGGVLGLADLGFVAGRNKPAVLAIMGPQNAGKTTLLGAWYLLLGRGFRPDDELRFSGSRSFAGWEVVASSLRWEPGPIRPTFPPHTSSRGGRIPGLLHLSFKRDDGYHRDYLMTDAPGEWFQKWAVNREARDAEGAQWAAEHADAFLLVADCEALSGPGKGAARSGIQLLARRLADELRGRPVALVWTKKDILIPEDMEGAVRNAVRRAMPNAVEFAVSIRSDSDTTGAGTGTGQGLLDLLRWVLKARQPTLRLPEPAGDNLDPLFIFGAR